MPPEKDFNLPFLYRDMLRFEGSLVLSLRVRSQSSIGTTINIRGFTREGMFELAHTLVNTGIVQTQTYRIPDFPIFITVDDVNLALIPGVAYIKLELLANDELVYTLASGLLSGQKNLSYPPSLQDDPIPGRGSFRWVSSSNPAAGAEISLDIPSNRIWHVLAARVRLVTNATAATRTVKLVLRSNSPFRCHVIASNNQTASLTRDYSFAQYGAIPVSTIGDEIMSPMPSNLYLDGDLVAPGGIDTETESLQAGDDFGAMTVLVEEFFANN